MRDMVELCVQARLERAHRRRMPTVQHLFARRVSRACRHCAPRGLVLLLRQRDGGICLSSMARRAPRRGTALLAAQPHLGEHCNERLVAFDGRRTATLAVGSARQQRQCADRRCVSRWSAGWRLVVRTCHRGWGARPGCAGAARKWIRHGPVGRRNPRGSRAKLGAAMEADARRVSMTTLTKLSRAAAPSDPPEIRHHSFTHSLDRRYGRRAF